MADPIRVNGNQYSWGSIVLKAADDVWNGFTAITYADKRERVHAYGMGRAHAPRGRSRGKYTIENVKLTGWKGSVQLFRAGLALKSADLKSYGDVEFQIVVQYIEPGEIPITVEIDRCVWVGNSTSEEEAPENLKEEIEIQPMLIRRNGLVLFDGSEGGP